MPRHSSVGGDAAHLNKSRRRILNDYVSPLLSNGSQILGNKNLRPGLLAQNYAARAGPLPSDLTSYNGPPIEQMVQPPPQ